VSQAPDGADDEQQQMKENATANDSKWRSVRTNCWR